MSAKRKARAQKSKTPDAMGAPANIGQNPTMAAASAPETTNGSPRQQDVKPDLHLPSGATPATPKAQRRNALPSPSHGTVKALSERASTPTKSASKGPHATRGWLPSRDEVSRIPAKSPLRALVPTGQGWTEAPSKDVQKKTRFAEVNRPNRPGAGPIFATSRHPGLVGVLDGHDEPIHALRFAPSGNTTVSASENGQLRHWDAQRELSPDRHLLFAAFIC